MPRDYNFMLLYCCPALDKLLLVNSIGCSAAMSGISSHPQFMPSLISNRLASRPTPEASVFRYKGFDASQNFIHASSLIIILALYRSRYILFYDHSVNFHRGSHALAVIGENILSLLSTPRNDCNSFLHLDCGMVITACTFLGSGLTMDCDIASPKNGMMLHLNRHFVELQICISAYPQHLVKCKHHGLYPGHQTLQLECHQQFQTQLAVPGTAHQVFSGTYLQLMPHKMLFIYIFIYQEDKRTLLGMMTAHLTLSSINECEVLHICYPG